MLRGAKGIFRILHIKRIRILVNCNFLKMFIHLETQNTYHHLQIIIWRVGF